MSEFRIFETDEFSKLLHKLKVSSTELQRIRKKLETYIYPQLRQEPFFGPNIRKLHDYSPETWPYRIGNYRIFYTVDEKSRIVSILTIDLRRDLYR